jgi:hypothetical protein
MRTVALFLLLVFGTAFHAKDNNLLIHRLIVQPDSQLIIDGKTNVNGFKCAIPRYLGTDTLVLHEGGRNTRPVFVKGSVTLDAASFDCGIALMTSDFRKTIKSKTYPTIVIDFISFERTPSYAYGEEKFKGIINISLGGVTKLFEMNCTIEAKPSGLIHLKGGRDFTFSDFNLQAPKHMMGLVKVEQGLNVNFHLVLKLDTNY